MMPSTRPDIAPIADNGMVTVMLHATEITICNELATESTKHIRGWPGQADKSYRHGKYFLTSLGATDVAAVDNRARDHRGGPNETDPAPSHVPGARPLNPTPPLPPTPPTP